LSDDGTMKINQDKEFIQDNKKPFNHVLEVQNGHIDARDIFRRIDERLLKEKENGKNGS